MPRKVHSADALTPIEAKFVANYNGDAKLAARLAGISDKNSWRYMKRPKVVAAIKEKEKQFLAETVRQQVHNDTMSRTYILKRLRALADLSPDDTKGSIAGQVSALKLGAELQGLIIERSADLTEEFKNRSEQELEFFSKNGYWPNVVDPGQSRPN